MLNLSQLESIDFGNAGGQRVKTIVANNSTIDLSSLTSVSVTAGQDDLLDFRFEAGGSIDLSSLTNVNATLGNGNERVRFFWEQGRSFALPVQGVRHTEFHVPTGTTVDMLQLQSIGGAGMLFEISSGGTVNLNASAGELTSLEDATIRLPGTATLNAPQVSDLTNVSLSLNATSTFDTAAITTFDNARIAVEGAFEFDRIQATSYRTTRNANEEILSARNGATLNLSQLESIDFGNAGGQRVKTIVANNSTIDLSSLTSVSVTAGQDDLLDFRFEAGGSIHLSSLTNVNATLGNGNERVRFFWEQGRSFELPVQGVRHTEFHVPTGTTVDMPQLQSIGGAGMLFEISSGGTVNLNASAGELTSLEDATIRLPGTATLNAPQVSDLTNVSLSLNATSTFDTAAITTFDNARIAVEGTSNLIVFKPLAIERPGTPMKRFCRLATGPR